MNIQITSRKFRAKDSLKDYIKKELKSLERINEDIIDANIILSYTHLKDSIKNVEMQLIVPGKVLTASDESDEFKKSITKVKLKLEKQLKTLKSKRLAKVK
ncbi:sigma 54 modulation protein / S30EA ribosomal protein [bacterium BMS3Abin04]|nr:sigma 54 modulation protein / S30EA ribosomal protein [bacterium BMS3Abin04]